MSTISNSPTGDENTLPNGWAVMELKRVLIKRNQGVNTTTEKVKYSSSGFRVIKAQDILPGIVNYNVNDFVDESEYNRLSINVKPTVNDVLYSNIGSKMGSAAKVSRDIDFIIAWNVLRLQLNKKIVNVDYLVHLLNFSQVRKGICNLNSSSTMPFVSAGVLEKFPITLPPLPEQKAIANILTAFDDKIELLQAQNNTLEQTAQTIFKEWFGKYQIGDELPQGWRVGKLGDISKLKSGYAFKSKDFIEDSSFKALKIKDLKGNGLVSISDVSSVSDECTQLDRVQYFKLVEGDIVLAMSGNTTGKIGIVPPHSNQIFLNQRVGKFFLNDETQRSFIYNFLMSGKYEEKILAMGYGSAQPNISPSQIENIDIVIPKTDRLQEFLQLSNPIYDKVLRNNAQIQTLKQTRDTLLPKLMSGEIRVDEFNN